MPIAYVYFAGIRFPNRGAQHFGHSGQFFLGAGKRYAITGEDNGILGSR
jgi:hypothetical protein